MTREEKAREYANQVYDHDTSNLRKEDAEEDFIAGAKWQAEQIFALLNEAENRYPTTLVGITTFIKSEINKMEE